MALPILLVMSPYRLVRRSQGQFCLSVAALALLVSIFALPTHAQDQTANTFSTSISPVTFELTAKPGDTLRNVVKVTNVSTQALQYSMEVEAFVGNELGQATIVPNNEESDPALALSDWTTISPATFTLKPREQQIVSFVVNIPKKR